MPHEHAAPHVPLPEEGEGAPSPRLELVECAGSPRDMGRQYGEQASAAIRDNLTAFGVDPDGA